ncbi:hypothetical protein Pmani_014591 [Petrolisthes manimaculis]|uniref:Uncharacterized protein n=1 Tax=Petrolisthes manimaculis TaxID=1843537 RepID=A0AAE1U8J4_9EUCA|nr:hypothetical protein Pmani_014591 [Petrolisthes manimaculis]
MATTAANAANTAANITNAAGNAMAGNPHITTNTENGSVAPCLINAEPPAIVTTTGRDADFCKIITFNIAGLMPYKMKGKTKLLEEIAKSENAIIISLTESHLNDEIRDAEVNIPKYMTFRTDRMKHHKKGGVITYVAEHFS